MPKIPLDTLFEHLFGIGKIKSKEGMLELIKKLREMPPFKIVAEDDGTIRIIPDKDI